MSDDDVVSGVAALLVAILDIGNLDFDSEGLIRDKEARDAVCDGLGILNQTDEFEHQLCGPESDSEHAAAYASHTRDRLSKALYAKVYLFPIYIDTLLHFYVSHCPTPP